MALIRLESRGSAIFRQRRTGRDGKEFDILKLRTMVDGAENWLQHLRPNNMYADNRLFKIEGDPRVTRLGRILRKTSLDETLQFVNVLRGEMSLVGPRPPLPTEVESYADHQWERLLVMPGITGPWQVAGRNHITSFDEVVRLERDYIRGWNLAKDLKIILKTIPAVLFMRGAH
jgi:lipopolysaccharide/colanic/teichoic acid biosynthesis glycosyltransferase